MLKIFAPSSLCVWSQMPWRNLQIVILPRNCSYELQCFDRVLESVMLWIEFSKDRSDFSKKFSQFQV